MVGIIQIGEQRYVFHRTMIFTKNYGDNENKLGLPKGSILINLNEISSYPPTIEIDFLLPIKKRSKKVKKRVVKGRK